MPDGEGTGYSRRARLACPVTHHLHERVGRHGLLTIQEAVSGGERGYAANLSGGSNPRDAI
jgi:hypothetical protein